MRRDQEHTRDRRRGQFPFLFGGTFIEANRRIGLAAANTKFPFLFGGTFIEAARCVAVIPRAQVQISLPFRRTFIEAREAVAVTARRPDFPSFSEGLSLRHKKPLVRLGLYRISLPFRRDFH